MDITYQYYDFQMWNQRLKQVGQRWLSYLLTHQGLEPKSLKPWLLPQT